MSVSAEAKAIAVGFLGVIAGLGILTESWTVVGALLMAWGVLLVVLGTIVWVDSDRR